MIWWVHTQRLPGAYAATSASSWSVVDSYLFFSTQAYNLSMQNIHNVVVVVIVSLVLRQWPVMHWATKSRACPTWRGRRPIRNVPVHCRRRSRCSRCEHPLYLQPSVFGSGTDPISRYTHLVVLVLLVGATVNKKASGSVVWNQIRMKFGRIVFEINAHRLAESDFWWCLTFNMADMTSFHEKA